MTKSSIPPYYYEALLQSAASTAATAATAAKYDDDDDDANWTFGQAYGAYLLRHGFDPDERDSVKYVVNNHYEDNNGNNDELAYVMLRYAKCHDF